MQDGDANRPILNIVGEKVALGPLHRDLLSLDHRWTSDFATLRMQGMLPAPVTMEWIVTRYESGRADDSLILFAVYERATMRPIGVTNFHSLDYPYSDTLLMQALRSP